MDDDSSVAYSYDSADWAPDEVSVTDEITAPPASSAPAAGDGTQLSKNTKQRLPGVRLGNVLVIKEEDVHIQMETEIRRVMELLMLSEDEAFVMLKQLKWNRSKLEETYFDAPDDLRSKLGVRDGPDPPVAPTSDIFCNVTLQHCKPSDADACACGHWFSKEAWQGHLEAAMTEPKTALTLHCMEAGCNEVVRPRMFKAYVDSALFARYRQYQVRSFLEEDPRISWCPAPGCTLCVLDVEGGAQDVECAAGHAFCFSCKGPAHRPAACVEVQNWLAREQDEGENAKWLLANTKPCPKCKRSIEKNQGCNHMICRPEVGGCSHHFCWVCLQEWETHRDYYNCNRRPAEQLYNDEASKTAKAELQRYTFYYEHYRNQLQGASFAKKTIPDIEGRQARLVDTYCLGLASLDFMHSAMHVIIRGRNAAAWAYVHGFYIPPEDVAYRALFEDSQAMLEHNLEELHELLEPATVEKLLNEIGRSKSIGEANLNAWRLQTINLQASTDRFVSGLLDAVDAGFVDGTSRVPDVIKSPMSSSVSGVARTAEAAGIVSPTRAKRQRTLETVVYSKT